jgi:hypothetical protein
MAVGPATARHGHSNLRCLPETALRLSRGSLDFPVGSAKLHSMGISWFLLIVSYLDSGHPFGACSRLVPEDGPPHVPGETLPGIRFDSKPKHSAGITRPHDQNVVSFFCSLGKEVSADTQACS